MISYNVWGKLYHFYRVLWEEGKCSYDYWSVIENVVKILVLWFHVYSIVQNFVRKRVVDFQIKNILKCAQTSLHTYTIVHWFGHKIVKHLFDINI